MPLSSASTLAEINAAIADNCDYMIDNSVAECRLFRKACLLKRNLVTEEFQHGGATGDRYRVDLTYLDNHVRQAETWLAANDPGFLGAQAGGGAVLFQNPCGGFRD